MKKHLLLSATLATLALSASAAEPQLYDASWAAFSPNNRYLVSDNRGGSITIYDLVENKEYLSECSEDGYTLYYSVGLGNIASNNGIVLGATTSNGDAAYWQNGEWHQLDLSGATGFSGSNGITPDGSRICGSLGTAEMTMDEAIMSVPCYWDRKSDGTYGEVKILPHPTEDFLGMTPQYITAIAISEDGKTIIGQMRSSTGAFNDPVIYKQDQNDNWTYTLPTKHLFNPDHLEIPPYPGEFSESSPSAVDFMSEASAADYQEAMNAWRQSGYKQELYPNADDFMTADEKAAFEKAEAEYDQKLAVWNEQYDAFTAVYQEVVATSPMYVFNNIIFSADGKYAAIAREFEDPNGDPWSWFPAMIQNVCLINLETFEVQQINSVESMSPTSITTDGTIFASTGDQGDIIKSYVIKDGLVQDLQEYLLSFHPEWKEWMDENLTKEIEMYEEDPITGEWDIVMKEFTIGGVPIASNDGKLVATWAPNLGWEGTYYLAVLYDLSDVAGIADATVAAGKLALAMDAQGNIALKGDAKSLEVFNLAGSKVASYANPGAYVESQLAKGIYLVRATAADGSAVVAKLAR